MHECHGAPTLPRALKFDATAPILLSVGRLTTRKGLAEFVDRGLPAILAVHPDALLVISATAADALHRRTGAASSACARSHRRVA
jgi:phosphatidylinositol alpha-1,6-mannosyltransferase